MMHNQLHGISQSINSDKIIFDVPSISDKKESSSIHNGKTIINYM